jgi:enamine deaminase RidA (YjgF/YER057c/UK114 family)
MKRQEIEMTLPSVRLSELGIQLPEAAKPAYNYLPAVRHGDTVYVSGQLPKENGEVILTGRVGEELTVEQAQRAARVCVLQGLACAAELLSGIDNIERVLRVGVFVASGPDFHQQPVVADAASSLLVDIFGDNGRHARAAIGVAELPRDVPVEIEFVFAARTGS